MRATKNAFKKVVLFQQQTTFNNNPHYQLDLSRSLREYSEEKTKEFLLKVLDGAIKTGQVNKDYDILSKYRGRQFTEIDNINSAAVKDLQTKAYSAGQQDVKILQEVLGEGGTFLYSSPCPMVVTNPASLKDVLVIGDNRYTVNIGLCTHLGCIPAWKKDGWKCACHGGEFNANGQQTFGPPPKPLVVPPFSLKGTVLTLGEEGTESKAMMTARA